MTGYWLLAPEILLVVGALLALFAERLPLGDRSAAGIGVLASLGALGLIVAGGVHGSDALFGGTLAFDGVAVFARGAVALLSALYLLWLFGRGTDGQRSAEAAALALFSAAGGLLLGSARDLITLFISIELSTMPAYILVGYMRNDERGLEGTLKYFLLSLTTSLIMLYGFSFLYGLAGSTLYVDISRIPALGTLGSIGVAFAVIGILAKLSAAPFHFWAPDAYAGASPSAVAFVSTVPKVAGAVALVELIAALPARVPVGLGVALAIVAAMSMVLGNLAAYPQSDLRRLMAYSGVAHTGYLLLALAVKGNASAMAVAVFYAVAYGAPSLAIMLVAAEEGSGLDDIGGLSARRPWLAWTTTVFLLSLIGIPPLAGFFGKFYLFQAALGAGVSPNVRPWLVALVALAVLMSVVSAGYYFRVVRAMFFAEDRNLRAPRPISGSATLAIVGCLAVVVLLGVAAGPLLGRLAFVFP